MWHLNEIKREFFNFDGDYHVRIYQPNVFSHGSQNNAHLFVQANRLKKKIFVIRKTENSVFFISVPLHSTISLSSVSYCTIAREKGM